MKPFMSKWLRPFSSASDEQWEKECFLARKDQNTLLSDVADRYRNRSHPLSPAFAVF